MSPVVIWLFKVLGLFVTAGGVFIAHKKYKTKPDNIIEEIIEDKIKDETGLDIDITPESSESDEKPTND